MKRRKLLILCGLGGLVFFAVMAGVLLSNRNDDAGRYAQLLRARRAEARFRRWDSPALRFICRVTKSNPAGHFASNADQLETALCKSGDLVWLDFFSPTLPTQMQTFLSKPRLVFSHPPYAPEPCVRIDGSIPVIQSGLPCVRFSYHDPAGRIHVLCRPQDVSDWRATFCCITNRVRWAPLREFAGDPDEVSCRLPDGSRVQLAIGQSWLNQSITDGWMVGIELQQEPSGDNLVVVARRKPGGKME